MLWFRNQPAMGTKWTFGIFFLIFVAWMRWAVLPRREEHCTGVAASSVGTGHRQIAGVIGVTVPGTLFRVMRRWTRFVNLSALFVVGFGAKLWEVRLTFDGGLVSQLYLEWYPPFVRHSGPPFVVPALVSLAWARVENHLPAGSMHDKGSIGRLVPPVVSSHRLILLETM